MPGKGVRNQLDKNNNGQSVEQSLVSELNKTPEQIKAEQSGNDAGNGSSSSTPEIKQDNPQMPGSEPPAPQQTVVSKFKLPDGRELTADQVVEEYKNLQKDYTVKTQELSRLKETPPERTPPGNNNSGNGNGSISPQQQAVIDELRRLNVAFKDEIPDPNKIVTQSVQAATSNVQLNQVLDELEEDFDGSTEKVGEREVQKPKIDRNKVMDFIVQNPNTDLSPMQIAKALYVDDFVKYESQRQLVQSNVPAVPSTEGNGAGNNGQPPANPKPALSFSDGSAETAVREILKTA